MAPRAGESDQRRLKTVRSKTGRLSEAAKPEAAKPEAAKLEAVKPEGLGAKPRSFRPQPPLWLKLLLWTQRGSSLVTLMLGAALLVTYGWTVYIQQQWGSEFDRLESLKKQERQLISASEVLKNQMAEQAEKPTAGLLLPDPSNAIFLTPAPQRPAVKASPAPPKEPAPNRPLGY